MKGNAKIALWDFRPGLHHWQYPYPPGKHWWTRGRYLRAIVKTWTQLGRQYRDYTAIDRHHWDLLMARYDRRSATNRLTSECRRLNTFLTGLTWWLRVGGRRCLGSAQLRAARWPAGRLAGYWLPPKDTVQPAPGTSDDLHSALDRYIERCMVSAINTFDVIWLDLWHVQLNDCLCINVMLPSQPV